jgi:hypothetical protein
VYGGRGSWGWFAFKRRRGEERGAAIGAEGQGSEYRFMITTVQLVFHTRMVQQKCLPVKRSGARRRQGVLQQPLKGTLLDNHGIPRGFGGQYLWPVHMDCQGSTPSA